MANNEYEICGTLTPKGVRRLIRRLVVGVVFIIGLAIWFVVSSFESDSHTKKALEEENLALCAELAKKNIRYPSSFEYVHQEYDSNNKVAVVEFTSKNSFGMTVQSTASCKTNGTIMELTSIHSEDE
jgi:hypothetical protein